MFVRYEGEVSKALQQWKTIAELMAHTTVMSIVTQGLLYYVQGTQVGYPPATLHLFRKKNTSARIGLPDKPEWRVNISGYEITIDGEWDEIKKVRRDTGYNLFQMLQLKVNDELDKMTQQKR